MDSDGQECTLMDTDGQQWTSKINDEEGWMESSGVRLQVLSSTRDKWPPSVIAIATAATTNTTIVVTAITLIRLVGTDQTNG